MVGRKKNTKLVWRRKDQSKASSSVPPPPPPPWTELPRDITANILLRLGTDEILESAQKVCTTWRSVSKDSAMWRKIDMSSDRYYYGDYDVEIMCQHAVDRSQGQLLDIKIGSFGTDELLEYIGERSSQLRCLTLLFCESVSDEGLTEAIKRFPLLEELHLSDVSVSCGFIEIIGRSCPMLKSFTLNKKRAKFPLLDCDNEALTIARAIPGLRHLGLIGNEMTDKGLVTILDGCTKLESLDLRRCFGVTLGGDLGKRCAQQLECMRHPLDPSADGEYDEEAYSDSFDDYPSAYTDYFDLNSDYDDFFDDFTRWDVDSDYEDFFGNLLMDDDYL